MATLGETAVGSIVKLNVKGELTDFIVVNQGRPSDMYDKSCDGTWVLMKNIKHSIAWNDSKEKRDNDYANSNIHRVTNSTFLSWLSEDIQAVVKEVKIPYRPGSGTDSTVNSGANGLSCKAFLLSALEVGFTQSNAGMGIINDGAKLDYFQDGNGTPEKIGYNPGNTMTMTWWLRTPVAEDDNSSYGSVWTVNGKGSALKTYSTNSFDFRPAFILPPYLTVAEDGTVTVPTIDFPSGGLGVQLQDNQGRPVLPQTRGDLVEGLNGDSVAGNLAELGADMQSVQGDVSTLASKQEQTNTEVATKLTQSGGAMTGTLADSTAAQVRNITLSTQDLEAGVSPLATGELYFVYE